MQVFDIFSLQLRLSTLMIETQSVMTLRILGISGVVPTPVGENFRMVEEKGPAMTAAFVAATNAMWAGARPDQIMSAAMVPVSDQVRSNPQRLTE